MFLVIIACLFCMCLKLTYKDTKNLQDYQLLQNLLKPNSRKNCFIFQQWRSTSLNSQKSVNISYPRQSSFHCLGKHLSGIKSLSVCRITGYTYNTIFYLASMIITAKHCKREPRRGAFTFSRIYR